MVSLAILRKLFVFVYVCESAFVFVFVFVFVIVCFCVFVMCLESYTPADLPLSIFTFLLCSQRPSPHLRACYVREKYNILLYTASFVLCDCVCMCAFAMYFCNYVLCVYIRYVLYVCICNVCWAHVCISMHCFTKSSLGGKSIGG